MSDEKVITLTPNRKYFEEIYFSGNQGSLFFSPTTKSKTITTIIVIIALLIVFLLKDNLSKENVGILYFLSFIFLLCAVYLSLSINKVSRWKKQVYRYLKTLEDSKKYEIRLNNESLNVAIDHLEEYSLWKDFTNFEINDKFISLEGKFNYMFPKKSMSEKDYNLLKKEIKDNIKP
jgi:hypothetical protein